MSTSKNKKYNQSENIVVQRSQINFAPYNPRKQDKRVVGEIKKNFKRVGYLGGIVWNEDTGNLVSGHKRLQAMDIIHDYPEKSGDYEIRVEKVNFDEKTEKEQNVFMNSQTVQGEFDYDLLADILPDMDYKFAGLDTDDLNMITSLTDYIVDTSDAVSKDIAEMSKEYDDSKRINKEKRKADVKAAKQSQREAHTEMGASYVTLSFDNYESKAEFLEYWGFGSNDPFIKGEVFAQKIQEKID